MFNEQIHEKASVFFDSFTRKAGDEKTTHYCPGCGHGILHKLLGEAIDDAGVQDRTVLVGSVGCSVFIYCYFQVSAVSAPHGRAPAVATGISRMLPDAVTISYQGDGDLAAIGTSHTIHAANRGENIFVLFVNNATYGMTGGQMAPTSLIGQHTTTTPTGRSVENEGYPIKMAELIASLKAPVFVARASIHSPKHIRDCRKLLRKALDIQKEHKGYAFLEVLAPCPTNWRKTPVESCDWIEDVMLKEFPLGVLKENTVKENVADGFSHRERVIKPVADGFSRRVDSAMPKGIGYKGIGYGISTMKLKIAGFGGQGVLSLGLAIAQMAMKQGLHVTWLPSYGPEMRGGVANCSVVISSNPIGSPIVDAPDVLVAMNKPALLAFAPSVPPEGHVFYNKSLIDFVPDFEAQMHPIEATNIAKEIGNIKVANTVLLGFLAKTLQLFSFDELSQFVIETFKKNEKQSEDERLHLREWNMEASKRGWGLQPT